MSLLTRTEFCKLALLERNHFNTYLDKGKFVVKQIGNEYMIDSELEINKAFIAFRRNRHPEKIAKFENYVELKRGKKKGNHSKPKPVKEQPQLYKTEFDTENLIPKSVPIPMLAEVPRETVPIIPPPPEINDPVINKEPEQKPKHRELKKPPLSEEQASSIYDLDKKIKETNLKKTLEEVELLQLKKEKTKGEIIPTAVVKSLFAQHNTSITHSFYNAAMDLITTFSHRKQLTSEEIADLKGFLKKSINFAVSEAAEATAKNLNKIVDDLAIKKGRGER